MDDTVKKFIDNILNMNEHQEYTFKECCGFTFVFETSITTIRKKISSAEIKPVGIIYEENTEYYLAPLDNNIKKEEIVKEYVLKNLI